MSDADTIAQALTAQEHWLHRIMVLDALENDAEEPSEHRWPRVQIAAAIEQAANMVERFNRTFMRSLRHLSDLRRYIPQVVVKTRTKSTWATTG